MKESEIIHTLFPKQDFPEDDCYFLAPDTLVTTDSLVEGTHFLHQWSSPAQIAEKLIEVNVSDIAASGGLPNLCFLNLGLSKHSKEAVWVKEFSKALLKRLKKYKMDLVGGDTFYSKTTHLTLTVFGKTSRPWFRNGGKDGDYLYLTGSLGDSQLGLNILSKGKVRDLTRYKASIRKHLSPESKIELIPHLQKYAIHACMDITDGLIQDSLRLSLASRGKLEIHMEDLPISPLIRKELGWDGALSSGEELELLFLSPSELPSKIEGIPISKIGRFRSSRKTEVTYILDGSVYIPKKLGFLHFKN
ncbi:thiamine-monophosphate kinase [Leptospira kobayashii]|uniref:Thiamine-monophosphate kinase n=1 Tax=Leptospira kobayashii TaxID=1917830 RepID=A0ABM7URY9_9LEPT|nr:thiamine-phosphate kinase [Leptospira kobayashii]BDA78404.1 thiamine-monophosphate kinase [Leptospira kobayashii]